MKLSPAQMEIAKYFEHDTIDHLLEQFTFIQELAVVWCSDFSFDKGETMRFYPIFHLLRLMYEVKNEQILEAKAC